MGIKTVILSKVIIANIGIAIASIAAGSVVSANASPLQVVQDQVCFYKGSNFSGQSFCVKTGQRKRMPTGFASKVSSIFIAGDLSATLCTGQVKRGRCRTYTQSARKLGSMSNKSRSYQVALQPGKVTQSKTTVNVLDFTIGKKFDLDGIGRRYIVAPDPAWQDVSLSRSTKGIFYGVRLNSINGVMLALGQGNKRSKSQCASSQYQPRSINMSAGMVGKYFCVKTNSGHFGLMKVLQRSADTAKISYLQW